MKKLEKMTSEQIAKEIEKIEQKIADHENKAAELEAAAAELILTDETAARAASDKAASERKYLEALNSGWTQLQAAKHEAEKKEQHAKAVENYRAFEKDLAVQKKDISAALIRFMDCYNELLAIHDNRFGGMLDGGTAARFILSEKYRHIDKTDLGGLNPGRKYSIPIDNDTRIKIMDDLENHAAYELQQNKPAGGVE